MSAFYRRGVGSNANVASFFFFVFPPERSTGSFVCALSTSPVFFKMETQDAEDAILVGPDAPESPRYSRLSTVKKTVQGNRTIFYNLWSIRVERMWEVSMLESFACVVLK